ncbi:MAG: sugar phosphate isomerase/epimerase [Clostridia bacterium]|nr:sugar phosphate isomerase/epimerase [Clostridia bacterium]
MSFYKELIPYAEKFGIKIACENIFQTTDSGIADGACADPSEFNKYIDDIANPYFTACLDLGHCNVTGRKAQNVLRTMGANRITALHIHDNDGFTDLHHLPLTVSMEWDEICKAIAEIGYKGNFTYEADGFLNAYSDEFIPTALKFMHDTGRYLISNIMNKQ